MILTALHAQVLEDWFFSTLNKAVQHCLRHQHQKTDAPKDIEGGARGASSCTLTMTLA